jgi:thioredoxin 1
MINDLTDKEFEQEVIKSDLPVLIDLWAPWCGPCRMIAPVVESLSEKYSGKLKFFRLNIDENPQTPARYRVMSIPTLMFFKGGTAVDMVVGAVPEKAITPKIEALL